MKKMLPVYPFQNSWSSLRYIRAGKYRRESLIIQKILTLQVMGKSEVPHIPMVLLLALPRGMLKKKDRTMLSTP